MSSQSEPDDVIDRLKRCFKRRNLSADVAAALRDAIAEIESLRAALEVADPEYRIRKRRACRESEG
jgi:hypothetical protein